MSAVNLGALRTACTQTFVGAATFFCILIATAAAARTQSPSVHNAKAVAVDDIKARLTAAYPGIVADVSNNAVTFSDGTSLPLDDGAPQKTFERWLEAADIEDMFAQSYPWRAPIGIPEPNFDPGRARNTEFFKKVYGDCAKGEVAEKLVSVRWLPKRSGRRIRVTPINRVAEIFEAVSRELDALPRKFDPYLLSVGGTYNCRDIAGTSRASAHSYGIAIDLAPERARYWRWPGSHQKSRSDHPAMPAQIVEIFEKHGFIWGGRWHHYDTMHFEYRPELRAADTTHP